MGLAQRNKGKSGERKTVHFLRDIGFHDARRSVQYCGDGGDFDIICPESLPNVAIENKFGYDCDLSSAQVRGWCEKADAQAGDKQWCIFWFPPRRSARLIFEAQDPGVTVCVTDPQQIRESLIWLNGIVEREDGRG